MQSIRYSPVLMALDERDRAALLDHAVERRLEPEDILFLEGEPGERIYLVLEGILKLVASDPEGRETILGLAGEGDLVGDLAVIEEGAHPLDAIAATRTKLLGFNGDDLMNAVRKSPTASLALTRSLTARLRWATHAALERTSSLVPARLAARLLDLADVLGRMRGGTIEMELPLSQADLGRLAGMCRESTCKTMRRFRAEGLLDYNGRSVRLLRPDLLDRIRCGAPAVIPSRPAAAAGSPRPRSPWGT